MAIAKFLLIGILLSSLLGCATMFNGTTQQVNISSIPAGAVAKINGTTTVTPSSVELKRNKKHTIIVEKEGCQTAESMIKREGSGFLALNLFWFPLGTVIGFAVDFGAGGAYKLVPPNVHFTLQCDERILASVPKEATAVPKEVPAVPKEIAAVPKEVTATPKEIIAVPKEIAAVPKEVTAVPKALSVVIVSLRKEPKKRLSDNDIKDMVRHYGFFDSSRNLVGTFNNTLVDNNDGTVTDITTGLMWQRGGSSESIRDSSAKTFIKKLNRELFAGYSDWRIPTIDELASLIEVDKIGGVHLDSLFFNQQIRCWSSDRARTMHEHENAITAWVLDYSNGTARRAHWWPWSEPTWAERYILLPDNYVRAVRSVK